jgi:transcriptional regulator with XRE-family HTH domain
MRRSSDTFVFPPELGARLRELRLKAGLTQLELARAMGRAGKKAGNLVGRLERGDERYPSFGLIADFLRGCRAGFKDIVALLDAYTSLPAADEKVYDTVLARVTEEVPERWRPQVTGYDRQLDAARSTVRPVGGRRLPDRMKRLERAKKMAAAARRRFLYGQYLKEAVDKTGLDPVMTVSEPLFAHGLEWFGILYRTRKSRPGTRERLLAASHDEFVKASRFPLDAIRKLEDGVRRQFGRMEMIGDLDWRPSMTLDEYEASLLAPAGKRSLKQQQRDDYVRRFNLYETARQAAVERMWALVQPKLDEAGVPHARRAVYRSVTSTSCFAALTTDPGSAAEKSIVQQLVFDANSTKPGFDAALAQKLADFVLVRFRQLAKTFPPDPRPKL